MSVTSLCYSLTSEERRNFQQLWDHVQHPTFLWVCSNPSFGKFCVCAISSTTIALVGDGETVPLVLIQFRELTAPWFVGLSSVTDGAMLLDCYGNCSEQGGRLLLFPTRDIATAAVEHIEFHTKRFKNAAQRIVVPRPLTSDQTLQRPAGRAPSVVDSTTESGPSGGSKKHAITLFGGDADHFHLANQKAFCSAAVSMWSEWRKGLSKTLAEAQLCGPLAKVLLSSDAQLKSKTHEVVVVTDRAFLIVKRRDASIVRVMLPIHAIEHVHFNSITEKNGALDKLLASTLSSPQSSSPTIAWDVLIQYDLKFPFTRGVVSDVSFTMTTRNKEQFLSALSRQYEELTARRLSLNRVENVFWKRRTLVQVNVMRAANKVIRRLDSTPKVSEDAQQKIAQDCQRLLTRHTLDFVVSFCSEASGDGDAMGFAARCLLWGARFANMESELLISCLVFELHRVASRNTLSGKSFGAVDYGAGFLRSRGQVDHILRESGLHTGGQYLRVLLSQCFEDLVHAGKDELMGAPEVMRWCTQLLTPFLTTDNETITNLFPLHIRELLTIIAELVSHNDSPMDEDGYRFVRDFLACFFIGSCIASPQEYGLVSVELEGSQSLNFSVISRVIQRIANGNKTATNGGRSFHAHASDTKADEASLRVIAATDPAVIDELSVAFQHYTDQLLLKGERRARIKRAVLTVLLRQSCGSLQEDVPAVSLLRWQVFNELLQGQAAQMMTSALHNKSGPAVGQDSKGQSLTMARLQRLMNWNASHDSSAPAVTAVAKQKEPDPQLSHVIEQLETSRMTEQNLSSQLRAATEKLQRLEFEVSIRESELATLSAKLRDNDAHSLPHEASGAAPPSVPMMEGQSLFFSPTTGIRRGPRWYAESASVFGCPLDSYDMAFSPSEKNL